MHQRIGKFINVIMKKKGKGVFTSNIRTIYLKEAVFNFNKKILSRDLMQCAERGNISPKEKYGSRKGGKYIMYDINKRLLYNVIHLQWQTAILCSNDIKSCYGRILNPLVSMVMQLLVMPAQPMKFILGKL